MENLPRPYRNQQDLQRMQALLIEGRRADCPTYYVHPGDLAWWLYYTPPGHPRWDEIYLWDDPGQERLLGWALLSRDLQVFDVFADPVLLGKSQYTEMLDWAEQQITESAQAQGHKTIYKMWVAERDRETTSWLEQHGYLPTQDYMWCLVHPLGNALPDPQPAQGYRMCQVSELPDITARLSASYAAFGSQLPFNQYVQRYRDFMQSPLYRPELDLVCVSPDGDVASFCICWLDSVNHVGLFEPVGTHPDFRQMGLCKALIHEGLRRMQAKGMKSAIVCVESDNVTAKRLYARLGFHAACRLLTYTKSI